MALARLVRAVAMLLLAALCVLAGPLPAPRGAVASGPAWPVEAAGCLAFLREGDAWLACPAGDVRLTSHGRAASPRLAPGAQTLAYLLLPGPASLAEAGEAADVRLLSLASGAERSAGPAPAPWGAPAWAPDGAALAWLGGGSLYLYDPAAGGPRALATSLAFREAPRPAPSWRADGAELYLPGWEGDARAVWAISTAGERRPLATPGANGPLAVAAAPSGDRLALADGAALAILSATGEALGAAVPLPAGVLDLAWSPAGERLALLLADGRLAVAEVRGDGALGALRSPGRVDAALRLAWADADHLAAWAWAEPSAGPNEAVSLLPVEGARALAEVPAAGLAPAGASAAALAPRAERPYEWYRYQGEADSGAYAATNSGPASVAMAIQFARNGLRVPIRDVRAYVGGTSETYAPQLQGALDHWSVANRRLDSDAAIRQAVTSRESIVLARLPMLWIAPGTDRGVPWSDPAVFTGRYDSFEGHHWLVVKAFTTDGQWAVVYDPNVWDGNGVYWYSNGVPKGRARYYRAEQLLGGIAALGYEAIEVFDPSYPTPTPSVTATPGPWFAVPPFGERVQNGSFEEPGVWSYPATAATALRQDAVAHWGRWSARLGLPPGEADRYSYSAVSQRLYIPPGPAPVTLTFWRLAGTLEPAGPTAAEVSWEGYRPLSEGAVGPWAAADWQRALVLDADGRLLEVLLARCEATSGWQPFTADLTRYRGLTIVLLFEVINDGQGGRPTWMYVDDVSVGHRLYLGALPLVRRR
ncbi:MAG: hypothetical protein GX657_11720 [Chloroflexi bacterium]|nr:hypothetical protein [Chloroflexota bacterium]